MYSLSQQDGYDFVEIPADAGLGTHAGTHYLEYDQYQVPIYIHTLEIPAGQEVQNVSLSNLANVSAAWGLQLPVSEYQIVSEASNPLARPVTASKEISAVPGHDWAPGFEQPFDWTVIHHVEGGSTLKLVLYPFNYDPAALYSEYSRHFEFNIETVATSVAITKASTDQAQYRLGEDILLSLELSNTDTLAVDAVVSAVLRAGGSGETLDGFTLSGLNGLLGKAQLQLSWSWADGLAVPPGDYSIEITVENLAGQRLASRNVGLRLGEMAGELSQLAVTPQNFQAGDLIGIQLDFANTGELPIDGEAVIQVQTLAGEILSELVAPISGLAAGSVAAVPYSWDSSGVAEGDYQVVGFVRYDSQTTPAVVQSITTLERVYLPLIRR